MSKNLKELQVQKHTKLKEQSTKMDEKISELKQ